MLAKAKGWAQTDPNARRPGQRDDLSDQHSRPKNPAELLEAWREIRDLNGRTVAVPEHRFNHGGVMTVMLLRLPQIEEFDVIEALLTVLMIVEERTESWVTIKTRQTTPYDSCARIQQGAEIAIANDSKVEVAQGLLILLGDGFLTAKSPATRSPR
jgi:ABC-type metal ion transport system substrate-binding protein